MSTTTEPAGYVPRVGDRVTVRRYIAPTTGKRTLEAEHAGVITDAEPHADGWFIRLDTHLDRIFTGYQFLGAGSNGQGAASLVTEVTPAEPGAASFARQLSPDLLLGVDGSGCIVLVVTGPQGKLLRVVTVGDVDAFKAALDNARTAQRVHLAEAERARLDGPDDKRRAEGRLTKREAVDWLMARTGETRASAVGNVLSIARGGAPHLGMTYSGGFWHVPSQQD